MRRIIEEMTEVFINDPRPFVVSYSGGKDSSVVLCEVLHTLELAKERVGKIEKTTYVIFSDTGLEPQPLLDGIHKSLDMLEKYARQNDLNVKVLRVAPTPNNTLLSKVIGDGMMLPTQNSRWCTDRMKIKPQEAAIGELLEEYGGFISITGVRKEESAARAERIRQNSNKNTVLADYPLAENCHMIMPIADWSAEDVWRYLHDTDLSYFDMIDAEWLGEIYAQAAGDGDECKTLLMGAAGEKPGCSKSGRFGCVICPLSFREDKMLKNLSLHYEEFSLIEAFRNWLMEYQLGRWEECRDIFQHGTHKRLEYNLNNHRKGMTNVGGYSLEFRKEILGRLKELDDALESIGKRPLLTKEELVYIQERWIEDGDYKMSAQKIYDRYPIKISEFHEEVVSLSSHLACLAADLYNYSGYKTIYGLDREITDRFVTQMTIQLLEKYNYEEILQIYEDLTSDDKERVCKALAIIKKLPVYTKQFHPSKTIERAIRKEWELDSIGYHAFKLEKDQMLLKEEYDENGKLKGKAARTIKILREMEDENYDPLDSEHLSLEEKMALMEDKTVWENDLVDNINNSFDKFTEKYFRQFIEEIEKHKTKEIETLRKEKVRIAEFDEEIEADLLKSLLQSFQKSKKQKKKKRGVRQNI